MVLLSGMPPIMDFRVWLSCFLTIQTLMSIFVIIMEQPSFGKQQKKWHLPYFPPFLLETHSKIKKHPTGPYEAILGCFGPLVWAKSKISTLGEKTDTYLFHTLFAPDSL